MKGQKFSALIVLSAILAGAAMWIVSLNDDNVEPINFVEGKMRISSSAFKENQSIPALYTCDGQDISPPLSFSDMPETAKSLSLIVDDPDAPAGNANPGWVHWIVYNIAAETVEIGEGAVPVGSGQGLTDFRKADYGGPCPPSSQHRYFFTLYALDESMTFASPPTKSLLIEAMHGHVIEQARLIGLYSRS